MSLSPTTRPPSPGRRRFLRTVLLGGAVTGTALVATRPAWAGGGAVAWRDGWLYRRLRDRTPGLADGVTLELTGKRPRAVHPDGGEAELNDASAWIALVADGTLRVSALAEAYAEDWALPTAVARAHVARGVRTLRRAGVLSL